MAQKIVPKGMGQKAASNVHDITSATGRRGGGRPSGLGYDPATGEEIRSSTYKETATRESSSEYDVFTLVDERGYRPDRFYTRSLNADGHGEKIQVRLPQGLDSQMYAAVAEVPQYRNHHDFVRDAIVHRLEWIQKHYALGDNARRTLELERIQADGERRAQEAQSMQEAVDVLEARLQMLWDREDWSLMAEELEKGGEMSDWLRDPYKTRAMDVVKRWRARAKAEIAKMFDAIDKG